MKKRNQKLKIYNRFTFIVLFFFIMINQAACTRSVPLPSFLDQPAKTTELIFFTNGNQIQGLTKNKPKNLVPLQKDFDLEVRFGTTKNCFHFMTSTSGITSFCAPEKKISEKSPTNAMQHFKKIENQIPITGIPARVWRTKREHTKNFKTGLHLRQGASGSMYWISSYALAMLQAGDKKTWQSLPSGNRYYDAVSDIVEVQWNNKPVLLLATPYNGLRYARKDQINGKRIRWRRTGKGLPYQHYVKGLAFYEAINSIVSCGDNIYAALGFQKGIMMSQDQGRNFRKLELPELKNKWIHTLSCGKQKSREDILLISGNNTAMTLHTKNQKIEQNLNIDKILQRIAGHTANQPSQIWLYYPQMSAFFQITIPIERNTKKITDGLRGVYLPAHHAKGRRLKKHLQNMKKSNLNAIVVDFKDDFGRLVYDSKIPMAIKAKAVRKILDPRKVTEISHKHGIKVIARLVVFKDKRMFFYKNQKYTLRNKKTNRAWQFRREFWVDPHNEDMWDYNIAIAKELQEMGIDEIQFDYIRFPTDGPTGLIRSTHNPIRANLRVESLYDFLTKANQAIDIPIGIDVYGFNAWYQAGAILGQDVALLSRQVQVISPMYYPSHFGNLWYRTRPRSLRSYKILKDGTKRAAMLFASSTTVRPYLQNFKWRAPTYSKGYILNQIQGVHDSGEDSYLFWNAAGNYRVVYAALKDYDPKTYKAK